MSLILELSKENLKLSVYEAISLLDIKKYTLNDNFLTADVKKDSLKLVRRLSYTNFVYMVLFKSSKKGLLTKVKAFNWSKYYKKDYCVRVINSRYEYEKTFGSHIWRTLKEPKVNVKNPCTLFYFIFFDSNVFATKLMWKNNKGFRQRKAHMRPALHPTSLEPRLAKACVNVALKQGILLDPFCGSGGILIEAGLMGLRPIGYDINERMLKRCRINLDYYKVKKFKLEKRDALSLNENVDAIVTDFPYGRNTPKVKLDNLIKDFLAVAYCYTENAVIMFPNTISHKQLLGKWKEKAVFEHYIHGSLTKRIVVLEH